MSETGRDIRQSTAVGPVVTAANELAARWCSHLGTNDFVISAAGLWPLLALLASAADEEAAAQLTAVLGRPVDSAQQDALSLIALLRTGISTTAALGIWTHETAPLHDYWASPLPGGVVETLTDQQALDQWASEQTGGLIEEFPLKIDQSTLLVLASALTARVRWRVPFDSEPRAGRKTKSPEDQGPADQQWLRRTTSDLTAVVVLDDTVTRVLVEGDGDVDVHLLLGGKQPSDVLGAGLRELCREAKVSSITDLVDGGPGLKVRRTESWSPRDQLRLKLPSFQISTQHDLLEYEELFGISLLTEASTSHLPHLSPHPLAISAGAQHVVARFFAEGFEAAAVTAFGAIAGGGPPEERYRVTVVDVSFERPFGFLAVHRPTGLAVVAGWVCSPFKETTRKKVGKRASVKTISLSPQEIEALKAQGYNQSQIAEMFGVSRQAVSWHLKTYGGRLSPRQIAHQEWPWHTTNLHGKSKVYQRLRDHGEFMLTQGRGMNEDKLQRLRRWWRKLREGNLVIEFDPDIPPRAGVSPHGGFAYRRRTEEDGDLLIRVNDYTNLTDTGRRIWCWPPDLERHGP